MNLNPSLFSVTGKRWSMVLAAGLVLNSMPFYPAFASQNIGGVVV